MTDPDRLAEAKETVKRLAAEADRIYKPGGEPAVERLRGLLTRLEWAGRDDFGTYCPACQGRSEEVDPFGSGPLATGHDLGCWLAAELHPSPRPEGSVHDRPKPRVV